MTNAPVIRHSTQIKKVVADEFGVSIKDMLGYCRLRRLVVPRQIAYAMLRAHTRLSLPGIGRVMGDRDHTTIAHGLNRFPVHCDDLEISHIIDRIETTLVETDTQPVKWGAE